MLLRMNSIQRENLRAIVEARSDEPYPTRHPPTSAAVQRMIQLASDPMQTADRLQKLWQAAVNSLSQPDVKLVYHALAQNPNLPDDLLGVMLRNFPTQALDNPVLGLKSLESPGWGRKTLGSQALKNVLRTGHPEAVNVTGPPDYSLTFKQVNARGGLLVHHDERYMLPDKIEIWNNEHDFARVARITSSTMYHTVNVVTGVPGPEFNSALGIDAFWDNRTKSAFMRDPIGFLRAAAD